MSSSVKNYFYACALSVCCACNMVCGMNEQNSANGVIINSGELRITNATQLLQLNENDVIGVNSVVLDGIDVNYDVDMKLSYLFRKLNTLSYINCSVNREDTGAFLSIKSENYSVINCRLTAGCFKEIFESLIHSNYVVRKCDFSNNCLSDNEELVFWTVFNGIFGVTTLDELNLSGNNFSQRFIDHLTHENASGVISRIIF